MLALVRASLTAALLILSSISAFSADKPYHRDDLAEAAIRLEGQIKADAGTMAKPLAALRRDADAAFARKASGIFNVADDEPSPAGDPLAFAAQLMGRDPPPEIAFAEAAPSMSPMALSFWQDCRRVRNNKLKRQLGVNLLYPTYREGLRALSAGFLSADSAL